MKYGTTMGRIVQIWYIMVYHDATWYNCTNVQNMVHVP